MKPEKFNERPHQNEKEEALDYIRTLMEQARRNSKLEDIPKLEKLIELINSKRYGLVWEEHAELVEEEMKTKIPVFIEDYSRKIEVDPAITDYNFLLEGDNLHSLHLLTKTHSGMIDVIYVDPPYNTGNNDFVYNDKIVDKEDIYFHSKWLSFMSKRLELARELLSEDGVIFISIDDNEQAQLKLLCNEIFQEQNFVTVFVWKVTGHTDNQDDITHNHEYIYCIAKNKKKLKINKIVDPNISRDSKVHRNFVENSVTKNGKKNPPSFIDLPKGFPCEVETLERKAFDNFENFYETVSRNGYISRAITKEYSATYPIPVTEMKVEKYQLDKPCKVFSGWMNNGKLKRFIDNGFQPIDDNGTQMSFYLSKNGVIYYRRENRESHYVQTVLENLGTTETNKYLLESMDIDFDYPKPIELIKYIISLYSKRKSIILDFFAGSGTTGHAVVQLNKEDGGNRKYIICTNNENNICEDVTYKRLLNIQQNLPHNLKYFKTKFINKDDEELEYVLLNNVKTLIELEHAIDLEESDKAVAFTLSEIRELDLSGIKTVYVRQHSHALMDKDDKLRYENIELIDVPEYYFASEMREAGL